jgi:hypothetical protein
MFGTYVFAAIALVAAGVVIGVIAMVSLGIHREERQFTLTGGTQDRVTRGARRLTGLYSRIPELAGEASQHRQGTLPV